MSKPAFTNYYKIVKDDEGTEFEIVGDKSMIGNVIGIQLSKVCVFRMHKKKQVEKLIKSLQEAMEEVELK